MILCMQVPMVYSDLRKLGGEGGNTGAPRFRSDVIWFWNLGERTFILPLLLRLRSRSISRPSRVIEQAGGRQRLPISIFGSMDMLPPAREVLLETVRPHLSDYVPTGAESFPITLSLRGANGHAELSTDAITIFPLAFPGYKIDECDASLRPTPIFHQVWMECKMNQILGMLLTKIRMHCSARKIRCKLHSMVRAGNLGSSRGYHLAFYSDRSRLREYVRMLCNSRLLRPPMVPRGMRCLQRQKNGSAECGEVFCLRRHTQLLNACMASGGKPWDFEDVAPIVRNRVSPPYAALVLVSRTIPLPTSISLENHPSAAMALEFSVSAAVASLDDPGTCWAMPSSSWPPFPERVSHGRVYIFPEGGWYALGTHEYYAGGQWHGSMHSHHPTPVFEPAPAPFCIAHARVRPMTQQLRISIPLELLSVSAQGMRKASSWPTDDGGDLWLRDGGVRLSISEATRWSAGRMTGTTTAEARKVLQTYEISNWILRTNKTFISARSRSPYGGLS
ncbi:MAG: hypothetical protein ACLR23_00050 [Clostridia bacterium]